ncbi:MAG: hypothetical protein K2Q22_12540, partial [Cytophagales bacterium]|nr:hypothetical protein [Cytophagales bacterium]
VNSTEAPQVQPSYMVCQKMPFSIPLTSLSGFSYKWYTQVSGGNPFYISSTGYANSLGISVATTIFVSRINSGTSCESIRLPVLITPLAKPVISSVTQKLYCYGVTVLSATGASINDEYYWYSNTSGTPLVGTGSSVTVNQVNPYLSNNYFVVLRSSVCESSKKFISAKFSLPVQKLPSITPVQLCVPGSAKISVGINIGPNFYCNWYTASVGGSLVYSGKNTTDRGASFTTPYLTKTTQWYVSRVNLSTECESDTRTPAEVRIGITSQPWISGLSTVTFPGKVTLSAATPPTGNSVAWFNSQGNSIGNGQSITVNVTQNQTIYAAFVSWSPSYCEGPRQPFDITYDPRVVLSTSTTSVCANSQVTITANFPGPYLWQTPFEMTTTSGNSF